MKKSLLMLYVLLVFTGVIQAQDDMDTPPIFSDQRADAPELSHRGDYQVGVQTVEVTIEGIVDIEGMATDPEATYDRTLTLEIWYPGIVPQDAVEMTEYVDDNIIEDGFTFRSRAFRDALPDSSDGAYPLIIMSHGLGGNRLQMTYLGDNLASKGYVVVAINHNDDTVGLASIQTATTYRPVDIQFTLDSIASMSEDPDSFLNGLADSNNTGLIGYSYGGYGTLVALGAGLNEAIATQELISPNGVAVVNQEGNITRDERIKAGYVFAPFGYDLGAFGAPLPPFWTDSALASIDVPLFIEGGSLDDVAQYETGIVPIFENATSTTRYLLTILEARHNVAPNPSPPTDSIDQFLRYGDSVWDSQRMNNIAQHFTTAFFGLYLQGQDYADYFDLTEVASEGSPDDGTQWMGFLPRTAVGMTFQVLTVE